MKNTISNPTRKAKKASAHSRNYFSNGTTVDSVDKVSDRMLSKLLQAAVGIMVLTVIHHVYGSILYEAPFRLHVAFIAIPVIVILLLTYRIFNKNPEAWLGKFSYWIFQLTTIAFPIGIIGLYEGGYNHLVKNVLFFTGSSKQILDQLFPAPTYEMPDDFWFEFSGTLQFLAGLYAGYYVLLVLQGKMRE